MSRNFVLTVYVISLVDVCNTKRIASSTQHTHLAKTKGKHFNATGKNGSSVSSFVAKDTIPDSEAEEPGDECIQEGSTCDFGMTKPDCCERNSKGKSLTCHPLTAESMINTCVVCASLGKTCSDDTPCCEGSTCDERHVCVEAAPSEVW
eukprot:gnl/MRDRNA2_/MRDRNA2_14617_c0_seq1.p1 gnl/MRDRNA2_/MRDRNA2_14617_c0~~gnl/MRDRNA2_/MRDRNA2_14617_c0_seq1.p1  ORF type:complete len:149 (-),score=17.05 gnl/MRDRNA2_/MRDRNA2_14617_c0_seq1:12-458(-)